MKFLRMTIFAGFLMAAMSVGVMAQKDDKQKPKPKPPVVNPGGQKPPNGNPPKGGGDKPKKPETSWFLFAKKEAGEELV